MGCRLPKDSAKDRKSQLIAASLSAENHRTIVQKAPSKWLIHPSRPTQLQNAPNRFDYSKVME